ncbi:MAG: motility protein A [Planctomycetaceae bacterium]|jgi:chemotaxis protein MotA|nr:motility protein A [Planctomycetaceae bacterium]
MGVANIIGLCLGWGLILTSIALGGFDKLRIFWDLPSVCIVFGGAVASCLVAYPLKSILGAHKYVLISFTAKERDPIKIIEQIVALSESARREGLLSLENHMDEIENNDLLKTGIRMAVDGMSPEVVESIMNTEIDAVNARHLYGKGVIANVGKYAPAFGMIGTLIGLVLMLADLDPDKVGAGMAVALLTTLYGAVCSNLMFLPWADKLGLINDDEMMSMEITLKGVIAIQAGENPRVVKQKLLMYLPPAQRPAENEEA